MKQQRRTSAFTQGLSLVLLGIMKDQGVTQEQVAAQLGRSEGYVSQRLNGVSGLAPDTDLIGAIGELAKIDGATFLSLVTQRMQQRAALDAKRAVAARRNADQARRLRSS